MNYKKYILLIAFCLNFSSSFAYDDNEIETFYYVKTIETIGKYVDEKNTTLWFLYEYEWFLHEKIEIEFDKEKLWVLYKILNINEENIKKQLLSLDISKNNVDIFVTYFTGKHPDYQKYLDLIKNNWIINSKDETGNNMFNVLLKNGTYDDIDFALNRWLNPNNKANNWSIIFYDFIKVGGKFYPPTYLDKLLAWKFDEVGTIAIINNFILKWFDVNLVDNRNENIIYSALDLKNVKILDVLLKNKKINLNIKNVDGKSSLYYAIEKWVEKNIIIEYIKNEKIDINSTDYDWNNLIQMFSNKENDFFKELFKRNININNQNKLWETELMKIISNNTWSTEIIEKYNLLSSYKPLKLDLKDKDGNNVLMKTAQSGKVEVLKELLKTFKNIKEKNILWQELLSIASATNAWWEMIQEILKLDIDINAVDNEGNSALHYAVKTINYDIINELFTSGIDGNILNSKNENILTYIIEKNDIKLLNMLLKYNLDINKVIKKEENFNIFLDLIRKDKIDLAKIILRNKNELKLDINFSDNLWQTALYYAIISKDLDLVKLLISNEIDINQPNKDLQTPLMIASQGWDINIINSIINNPQIKINDLDKDGKNALIYACIKSDENTIKALINNKIDIKTVDKDGKKCLDYIKESKNISKEIFEFLK